MGPRHVRNPYLVFRFQYTTATGGGMVDIIAKTYETAVRRLKARAPFRRHPLLTNRLLLVEALPPKPGTPDNPPTSPE